MMLARLLAALLAARCTGLAPVVLVPGLAGSVFEAKLNGAPTPHAWCRADADW